MRDSIHQPVILLYHRVASDPIDAQMLCVTEENFEGHLAFLRERRQVVPLKELLRDSASGGLRPGTVAVTFDDGYLDNLTAALPLLSRYALPAMVFVATGFIGSEDGFWGDVFERLFFSNPHRPASLLLRDGRRFDLSTADSVVFAHDTLRSELRPFPYRLIRQCLSELSEAMSYGGGGEPRRPVLSLRDLEGAATLGAGVDFGAHGVTHSMLSGLPVLEQRHEMTESRRILAEATGQHVDIFAYPYGSPSSYNDLTKSLCREVGFTGAVANTQGPLTRFCDAYNVPRYLVRDWDADEFARWMDSGCDVSFLDVVTLRRNRRLRQLLEAQDLH